MEDARRLVKVSQLFGPMERALVVTLLYSGLRRDELRTLEWRGVADNAEWISVTGKGRKERQVPLHEDAQEALMSWRAWSNNPLWVFPSTRYPDRPMSTTWLARVIREVGEAAGIERLHPHALRHTVATRMLERGGNLRAVQEFLGHSNPNTTATYTKVRPAKVKESADLLDFDEAAELRRANSALVEAAGSGNAEGVIA